MNSFLKDISSVGISRIAIIFFGLGRGIITARWLGPETNGIIAALAVYPSLFMSISSLGIKQSVTYFTGRKLYTDDEIKTSVAQLWILSSIISTTISFLLIRYFSNSGTNLLLVLLAVAPMPFSLFVRYNSGIFLGKNQISVYNKINWLPTAVTFIFTALLIIIIPMGINGYLIASISGSLFMFFLLLIRNDFINAFRLKIEWKIIGSLLSLGIVYAISLLVLSLNYKINIIMLDKLSSPFELGIFSKGVGVVDQLWEIPTLLSTIVFARSANAKNSIQYSRKVAHLLRLSFVFIGAGSICLLVLSKQIILLLFGKEFILSTGILQILMPGVILMTIVKVLNMDLAGRGKPWISMKAMIPALIINITLSARLTPEYGGPGAAFASTLSYSIAALLFLYFYSREVKIPIREILNYSKSDFDPIKVLLGKLKSHF